MLFRSIQIDDYRILEKLGEGGMGVFFRARQISLGRDVAIKILTRERVGNETDEARFLREAKALSSLSHPHVIKVFSRVPWRLA